MSTGFLTKCSTVGAVLVASGSSSGIMDCSLSM
eukprot:CAMPEP_0197399058 /NCGR_PEP_ID=MMETSP1165-20131217/14513_1 /TAXON_ID=284809 /ORGANISM="Chrysocystis fragilis, Strain CCMP3189" /LENGTH=32 /DNA_ID= /DNA_START= /DNA_END= /DNA_ORIENTATION=